MSVTDYTVLTMGCEDARLTIAVATTEANEAI